MRETIKYVDADHKFGKTIIYTDLNELAEEYKP